MGPATLTVKSKESSYDRQIDKGYKERRISAYCRNVGVWLAKDMMQYTGKGPVTEVEDIDHRSVESMFEESTVYVHPAAEVARIDVIKVCVFEPQSNKESTNAVIYQEVVYLVVPAANTGEYVHAHASNTVPVGASDFYIKTWEQYQEDERSSTKSPSGWMKLRNLLRRNCPKKSTRTNRSNYGCFFFHR